MMLHDVVFVCVCGGGLYVFVILFVILVVVAYLPRLCISPTSGRLFRSRSSGARRARAYDANFYIEPSLKIRRCDDVQRV